MLGFCKCVLRVIPREYGATNIIFVLCLLLPSLEIFEDGFAPAQPRALLAGLAALEGVLWPIQHPPTAVRPAQPIPAPGI